MTSNAAEYGILWRYVERIGGRKMQTRINDTLGVEIAVDRSRGGHRYLRIVREAGGVVAVELSEVKALVAALTDLGARAAAEAVGDDFVETSDLW